MPHKEQHRRILLLLLLIPLIWGINHYMESGKNSGTFNDFRDGQTYKYVRLKDGKNWMAQNLNYKMPDSWCYNDEDSNCKKYGRLYTWLAAKKACPKGWHLPSDDEWWAMVSYYERGYNIWGSQQKNININNNINRAAYKALIKGGSSGFSALLGGNRGFDDNYYGGGIFGGIGYYWSSTEHNASFAWYYRFDNLLPTVFRLKDNNYSKSLGFSCRCVQD